LASLCLRYRSSPANPQIPNSLRGGERVVAMCRLNDAGVSVFTLSRAGRACPGDVEIRLTKGEWTGSRRVHTLFLSAPDAAGAWGIVKQGSFRCLTWPRGVGSHGARNLLRARRKHWRNQSFWCGTDRQRGIESVSVIEAAHLPSCPGLADAPAGRALAPPSRRSAQTNLYGLYQFPHAVALGPFVSLRGRPSYPLPSSLSGPPFILN